MYLGIILKVRAHAHDVSDQRRTNASAANELILITPFSLRALFQKSEYWEYANEVQVITGGRMISRHWVHRQFDS